MSSSIRIPGHVCYPSLRLDEDDSAYKPYASYVNGLILAAVMHDGTIGRSPSMDGDLYARIAGRIRLEYLDSPWGNDHYYVYQDGRCVFHCQDTPGRMTIQEHWPGDWLSELEELA